MPVGLGEDQLFIRHRFGLEGGGGHGVARAMRALSFSLGINLNPGIANQIGVPVTEGIAVARVFPETGAEEAGLQERDVIVRMGNESIRNTGDLSRFLMAHLPGEMVTVVFFRGMEEKTTEVTLQERPVGRPYGQP